MFDCLWLVTIHYHGNILQRAKQKILELIKDSNMPGMAVNVSSASLVFPLHLHKPLLHPSLPQTVASSTPFTILNHNTATCHYSWGDDEEEDDDDDDDDDDD